MSLLTSQTTTKQQLKFLNRMQRHYHKRGASQYIPRQRQYQPPIFTTKASSQAITQIKQFISSFMTNVTHIIKKFNTIDHYLALEILRKHQFFSDVAMHISADLYAKIQILQKDLLERDQKIERLRKQLQQNGNSIYVKQKLQSLNHKNVIKYNPAKSIAANLYYQAKAMQQQDFVNYYNKINLSNPITLKKVQTTDAFKQKQSINLSQRLAELMVYSRNHNNQDLILQLISTIKTSIMPKQCRNPCCIDKPESPDTRLNKAKTLMNTTFNKSNRNIYKNDKSQQYFKRYYRGSGFNIQDVTSVTKTKLQQMQKIQNQHKKNLKARKKQEIHHRYSYSFTKN